jgi:hypothetical protein
MLPHVSVCLNGFKSTAVHCTVDDPPSPFSRSSLRSRKPKGGEVSEALSCLGGFVSETPVSDVAGVWAEARLYKPITSTR